MKDCELLSRHFHEQTFENSSNLSHANGKRYQIESYLVANSIDFCIPFTQKALATVGFFTSLMCMPSTSIRADILYVFPCNGILKGVQQSSMSVNCKIYKVKVSKKLRFSVLSYQMIAH